MMEELQKLEQEKKKIEEKMESLKKSIDSKRKDRQELQDEIIGRVCVCTDYRDWDGKPEGETTWHCNAKTCVWWNICTIEHSTPYTKLDLLYKLTYMKGFCKCEAPKEHEIDGVIQKDYFLCVNDDCFKVFREYEKIVVDQRLYQ